MLARLILPAAGMSVIVGPARHVNPMRRFADSVNESLFACLRARQISFSGKLRPVCLFWGKEKKVFSTIPTRIMALFSPTGDQGEAAPSEPPFRLELRNAEQQAQQSKILAAMHILKPGRSHRHGYWH